MDREKIKLEFSRVRAAVRNDFRVACARVDTFLYSIRLDVRYRLIKTKKAAQQIWQELWR